MKKKVVLIITLILTTAIVASVALILVGSNSVGPISMSDVEKIEVGMTEKEVLDILGYNGKDAASGLDRREWDIENGQFLCITFLPATNDDEISIVEEVSINDYSNAIVD